jgi:hypothetical protein
MWPSRWKVSQPASPANFLLPLEIPALATAHSSGTFALGLDQGVDYSVNRRRATIEKYRAAFVNGSAQ